MKSRLCFVFLLLAACGFHRPPVEDLTGEEDVSLFKLQSVRGTRDGDRLIAKALFSDSSSILTVDMHFLVGSPTKLESGNWSWSRPGRVLLGELAERSVTFLGGQDGPPSMGGSFDLLTPEGKHQYRINIPVTELKR